MSKLTKNGLKPYNYDAKLNSEALTVDGMKLAVGDDYLSHIEGKIITLFEGMIVNLTEPQHRALKSLIRDAIWSDIHGGWACPMTEDKWDELVLEVTGK